MGKASVVVGGSVGLGEMVGLGPRHQAAAWAPSRASPHRYATTPSVSSCTAADPSTSVRPVTASSTAPCIMMGTSALTCPPQVSSGGGAQPGPSSSQGSSRLLFWGHSVLATAGTVTGPSEGQELTVHDETQVHLSPFCSTSFLTREKAGDCSPAPEQACLPGAGLHLPQRPRPWTSASMEKAPLFLSSGQGTSGQE